MFKSIINWSEQRQQLIYTAAEKSNWIITRVVNCTFLQGGAQNGAGLTAFVLISLLENNDHDAVSIL